MFSYLLQTTLFYHHYRYNEARIYIMEAGPCDLTSESDIVIFCAKFLLKRVLHPKHCCNVELTFFLYELITTKRILYAPHQKVLYATSDHKRVQHTVLTEYVHN